MIKGSPVLLALVLLAGCANGPARWAEDVAERLECGMAVEQVQRLSSRPLEAMEVPRDWMTHFIRDNATDLWLGFDQGKLRWSQVAWAARMMKMATYQRVDHCGGQSPK